MPTRNSGQGTGLAIWEDFKIFLTACLLFCFLPLGLILMWSWDIWTPRIRKIVTWIGVLALPILLAIWADHRKNCGHQGWGRGCGWHQKSCGHDQGSCGSSEDDDEGEEAEEEGSGKDGKMGMESPKAPAESK